MTDRYKGFVVTLENDIRSDDAQSIINAIRALRGVLSVTPSVADVSDHMNRQRIRMEFQTKLFELFKDPG